MAAIVGGAKVSTKLELLGNLVGQVDVLIIGGAMANTFLAAQGKAVGKLAAGSRACTRPRATSWRARRRRGCEVLLPVDAVVAAELKPGVRDADRARSTRCRPTR